MMEEWGWGISRRFRDEIAGKRNFLEELRVDVGEEAEKAEERCREVLLNLLLKEE